jgi:hypothetical protein
MSLPLPWVDKIFEKLALTYGQQFLSRWRDLDLDAVKFDWAKELDGFQNHPKAIAFALQNLDAEKPPTVRMFVAIAMRAPPADLPRLTEPAADPARVAAEFAKLAPLRQRGTDQYDHKSWARRLKDRHQAGEKLNHNQIRCYTQALGISVEAA